MDNKSGIDPLFFEVIASWFNLDLIDLRSDRQIEDAAGAAAADLSRRLENLDQLITQLENVLDAWNSSIVMDFIRYTDVDWLADEETEAQLKLIVAQIIKGLKHFTRHRDGTPSQL